MKRILLQLGLLSLLAAKMLAQNNALVLNGAFVVFSGGSPSSRVQLVVNQSSTNGIVRSSGHIISEGQFHAVKWNATANNGSYVFPFGYSTSDYIPLSFIKNTTNSTSITVSTWASAQDNTPWATANLVASVTDMTGVGGATAENSVIDRWWEIGADAGTIATIEFRYRGAENTTTINPSGNFQAQNWTGNSWNAPIGAGTGVTTGTGAVTATGTTTFTPWVLTTQQYALPIGSFPNSNGENNTVRAETKPSVYPNPFDEIFIIELSNKPSTIVEISITSMEGKLFFRQQYSVNKKITLKEELREIPAGMYILCIRDDNECKLCSVIKR
jgi:hypothetical protein